MTRTFIAAALALALAYSGPAAAGEDRPQGDHPSGVGVVNAVDAAARSVTLSHEPIPALGWPAMTMSFTLTDAASIERLSPGDRVKFTLSRGAGGLYAIDSIEAIGPAGAEGMPHMAMAEAGGAWAYGGRDNPPPLAAGRWEMVPTSAGGGAEWRAVGASDQATRCAALMNNSAVMVDHATRRACAGDGPPTPLLTQTAHHGGDGGDDHGTGDHDHGDGGHDHGAGGHEHGMSGHWMAPKSEQGRPNPVAVTEAGLARAAELFEDNCAVCHGASGAGDGPAAKGLDPPPADLKMMAGMHTDGDFAWKIRNGRNTMPAWGELLDDDSIWELVNYIKRVIAAGPSAPAAHRENHGEKGDHHD